MEPFRDAAAISPEAVVTSSPEIFSPGGKSRYGRTRRPKIKRDFCNTDDVVVEENPQSKLKSPRKLSVIRHELVFDSEDEFTKLDDLGMRVANNFKMNLQRGQDDTIKERKFFKTVSGSRVDVPNVVDVTKVLKLISKPNVPAEVSEVKATPKSALKTYSNKRKHVHDSESFVVESFGLPDEPIIPVKSPLVPERNTIIDIDISGDVDINLKNPWGMEDLDPVPLYASEPVTSIDELNFRDGMHQFLPFGSVLNHNTELLEAGCSQDNTNFEKSRIPTPEKKANQKRDSQIKEKVLQEVLVPTLEHKGDGANGENSSLKAEVCRKPRTQNKLSKRNDKLLTEVSDLYKTEVTCKIKPTKGKVVTNEEFKDISDFFGGDVTPSKTEKNTDFKRITRNEFQKELIDKKKGEACPKEVTKENGKLKNISDKLKPHIASPEAKRSPNHFNRNKVKALLEMSPSPEIRKSKMAKRRSFSVRTPTKLPKRILRSSFDNNNTDLKKYHSEILDDSSLLKNELTVVKDEPSLDTQKEKSEKEVRVNRELRALKGEPSPDLKKLQRVTEVYKERKTDKSTRSVNNQTKIICSPQVRVVLNPLSYTHKHLQYQDPIIDPLKFKNELQIQNKLSSPKELRERKTPAKQPPEGAQAKEEDADVKKLKKDDEILNSRETKTPPKLPPEEVPVKEEDVDVKNLKKEVIEFHVGDLAWAKIGSHPYWPCMVTREPVSGEYRKLVANRSLPLYHVRFFGDKGRRAWVSAQYVMLFFGRDDLDKLLRDDKTEGKKSQFIREACVIRPRKLSRWRDGVSEAESLKSKSLKVRLRYFFDLFTAEQEKKKSKKLEIGDENTNKKNDDMPVLNKKRSRVSGSVDFNTTLQIDDEEIKSEIVTQDLENVIKKEKEDGDDVIIIEEEIPDVKRPRTSLSVSPKKKILNKSSKGKPSENASAEKTPNPLVFRSPKSLTLAKKQQETENPETPPTSRRSLRPEEFTEESIEARKKLRNSRIEPESSEPVREQPDVSKILTETPQIPNSSDTDSKFSDNSSVPTSLESQAALFRRNNIFRGIPREKVCQVCEEGGEVFKCKGPCNGVYHQKCATKQGAEEGKKVDEVKAQEEEQQQNNVEIISVASSKPLPDLSNSPNYKGMTLAEKIDFRMKEIMKKFDSQTVYSEATDSSEECGSDEPSEMVKPQSKPSHTVTRKPVRREVSIIQHVTADNISYIYVTDEKPKEKSDPEAIKENAKNSRCGWCATGKSTPCLICHTEESTTGSKILRKCSLHQCGKYYHSECLKSWPQTQWSFLQSTKDKSSDDQYDTFVCPRHVCHTCISDDPRAANSRCPSDKVVKCLKCPATYHSSNYCVPAGTHILSASQVICPRHSSHKKKLPLTINTNWCFICAKGGNLICCETCPTSVHVECLPGDFNADETFFCEDCQSGRLPLYDEIVWVKLGSFRWWPALILFPNEVPDNVKNMAHNRGEFVVKFYGTHDHYWVGRGRTFLFQEGDKGHSRASRKRVDYAFVKAIEEAAAAHVLKKQFKMSKMAEKNSVLKPPPYIKIKANKPVGNVRLFDGNTSNTTSCECDPNQPHPCGPDSDCLNRLLLTECNPEVCPAGERCNNQCFEKREYPPLVPHRTEIRGWGLKTLAPIRKGQFVIEYVGEIIDDQEYQRRIQKMHEAKEENYYFLTIDKDRTLDAGPKGNVARFMNHSCQPNCETQKWTVNCDTRVGLFAQCDIPADTELTFNYNLECIGKEKKICRCGAPNCSGFIGVKVKQDNPLKKSTKPKKKKVPPPVQEAVKDENPCFICDKIGDVGACNNKICTKYYHLTCVGLKSWPEGGKWICPWHNCNICSKRTIRCCVKCVNSYCPSHSEGYVRHDKQLGFVCFEHDPTKVTQASATIEPSTSAVSGGDTKESNDSDNVMDAMSLSLRLNGCVTSTPVKKSKGGKAQEESASKSNGKSISKKNQKKKAKRKRVTRVVVRSHVKHTANLFKSSQKEIKLSKFTPVRHSRVSRSNTRGELSGADPDKDLPLRKRTRLRCQNT